MNERYEKLADSTKVNHAIGKIAADILRDHQQTPLFVALLRGAAPFSAKLMLKIANQSPDYHPELDYMMVSTYGSDKHAGQPQIVTDLAPKTVVQGRPVVIIDDVLDKGITADFVFKHLKARGAAKLQLAVLCDKKAERQLPIEADYCGFSFEDNCLVGVGMDDAAAGNEGYRWLDEIWQVKQPQLK